MKKKRYSTDQLVAILKQAEMGLAVLDLIRQIGFPTRRFTVVIPSPLMRDSFWLSKSVGV